MKTLHTEVTAQAIKKIRGILPTDNEPCSVPALLFS
jgi:hypothetical protein